MIRTIAFGVGAFLMMSAAHAFAQESAQGPGQVEIAVIPAGATFFTSKGQSPEFGNYTYGGALTYHVTRIVGVEGEIGGTAGVAQDLTLNGGTANLKTPNTFTYSGNLVLSARTRGSLIPFVTGGVGGLTMFARPELGVNDRQTFLTGNVGGGVKWYPSGGRLGLRADYRFIAVRGKDTAPAFFGQDTEYGHRVYVGVLVNAVR